MKLRFTWLQIGLLAVVSIIGFLVFQLQTFDRVQVLVGEAVAQGVAPMSSVWRKLDGLVSTVTNLQQVSLDNLQLRRQVSELTAEVESLQAAKEENDWLKSQMGIQSGALDQGTLSQVLRYEFAPQPGYVYVTITADVRVGDLAVSHGYIVGEVVEQFAHSVGKIRLIFASGTHIPVEIGENKVVGVLTGEGGLVMQVREVDNSSQVKVGDKLKYFNPRGQTVSLFSLGEVSQVQGSPADPSLALTITHPVDMYNLERVIIIANQE